MIMIHKNRARKPVELKNRSSTSVAPLVGGFPIRTKTYGITVGDHVIWITEAELLEMLREWRALDGDAQF